MPRLHLFIVSNASAQAQPFRVAAAKRGLVPRMMTSGGAIPARALVLVVSDSADPVHVLQQVARDTSAGGGRAWLVAPPDVLLGAEAPWSGLFAPERSAGEVIDEIAAAAAPGPSRDRMDAIAASIDEHLDKQLHWALQPGADARVPVAKVARGLLNGRSAGRLDDDPVPLVLARAFTQAATGRLVFTSDAATRTVYVAAGRPVLVASNQEADRMVEWLLRTGRVSDADAARARTAVDRDGQRMGAALVELGVLKPGELLPVVRGHFEELLVSACAWRSGSWRFEAGVSADPRRVRLLRPPADLVRQGLVRGFDRDRLMAMLGSGLNRFALERRRRGVALLDAFSLSEEQRQTVALFDGARCLDDVVKTSRISSDDVLRLAAALVLFGVLAVRDASAPSAGEAFVAGRDHRIDRARVRALAALARESDYFRFLGLPRDADDAQVRAARVRLEAATDDQAVGPEIVHDLSSDLFEVRQVLSEAVRVLSSDSLRARYRAALQDEAADEPSHT